MSTPAPIDVERMLEHALAARLAADTESALRLAASVLAAEPAEVAAAALVARLLHEAGRGELSQAAREQVVDGFIRRGELAQARVALALLGGSDSDIDTGCAAIAQAFGSDSPRLGAAPKSARPPPLGPRGQGSPAPAPFFARASGAGLLDAAAKALQRYLDTADPVPADRPVPRLPLFGALPAARLAELLAALELVESAPGSLVIRQGAEGQQAFVLARGQAEVVREQLQPEAGGEISLATLRPGAIFGEMALLSAAPRAASVRASTPLQLLAIRRDTLEQLAREDATVSAELARFCHQRMLSNLMRHGAVLSALSPSERAAVMGHFQYRSFEQGERLVTSGEEGPSLFLLASGSVAVRARDADGETIQVAELGPGHVVGEISLLLRRPANADVVALHPTVTLELSREQLQQAIRQHPELLRELYDIAVQRDEQAQALAGPAIDIHGARLV